MCGIAGSVNMSLDIPGLTRDLWHRGPDDQRTETINDVILHHHRLAILDIASGTQPMHLGPLTIIFNGEIYNHQEVRKALNLDCSTQSDTETILHAYAAKGAECLNYFDGMFALAIHDKSKNELFFARDRAGEKPFYYYQGPGEFAFSSELGALYRQTKAGLSEEALKEYIRLGFFYKDQTPYKGIKELPPGYYGVYKTDTREFMLRQWWSIRPFYALRSSDNLETAMEKVDHFLHHSIQNRMESSDLEVGSFLSGGIDSGIVTAIASQYNSTLKTFTVSFENGIDEAPLARLVAEKYDTHHHEIRISFSDLLKDVERILTNYGEPHYDDSAIPSYYVSREARKHLTVILNGDGGDELFAGYRRYVPFSKFDFFRKAPLRRGIFRLGGKLLPVPKNKTSILNYLDRLSFLGSRYGLDTYLAATTDIFEGYGKQAFCEPWQAGSSLHADFDQVFSGRLSGLQKQMLLDFEAILPGLLLVKMDIASMANSLEGRSPFLSSELLEYVPSLSDDLKIKGTTTKYLLRQLAKKYLPAELINQPKRGFEPPINQWVEVDLKEMIADYLHSGNCLYDRFVRRDFMEKLFDRNCRIQRDKRTKMIWMLFTLEVWYQKVYKGYK